MQTVHPPLVRTRLSAMMFLEFFVWGGWYMAISGYAIKTLQFTGPQVGWLMSTTALGAIIAPLFVGYVADRFFATERMLSFMHFVGGLCLILAAQQKTFVPLMALLMVNGLFFMPTMALANSLAFRHIPDPAKFPRIALLGTIGWIVSNLIVAVALGGAEKPYFFYVSGGGGIVMALYCLTLPHTPPKGKGQSGGDVFGVGALRLLKESSFLIFTICAFLVVMPACTFFVVTVPMLQECGYPAPLALMTLNQFSEMFFMFTMPLFVVWLGLKRVLTLGMLAWGVRYLCFAAGGFPMAVVGLLLHGFCYSFVFVGAYMYVDQRAPADIKASAQSLISFLMLGVGWFIGCKASGSLLDYFPPQITTVSATVVATGEKNHSAPLPRWDDPAAATSVWRYLDLSGTINTLRTGEQPKVQPDLAAALDANKDGQLSRTEIEALKDHVQVDDCRYSREELLKTFDKIAGLNVLQGAAAPVSITRQQYLAAQSHRWGTLWLWPAGASLAICAFFALAFRDKQAVQS